MLLWYLSILYSYSHSYVFHMQRRVEAPHVYPENIIVIAWFNHMNPNAKLWNVRDY